MRTIISFILTTATLLALIQCGSNEGGTEAGNPPAEIRELQGQISLPAPSLTKNSGADCDVDEAVSTDSAGNSVTAGVSSDCLFSLDLTVNKSYSLEFHRDGAFAAQVKFRSKPTALPSPVTVILSGTTPVNLGLVVCEGEECTPENEPAGQNDRDGDGESDFDDDDAEDEDCDLDGYPDGFDEDEDECEGEEEEDEDGNNPAVVQVSPTNNDDEVDLDEEVMARFECEIDGSTVTAASFAVRDPLNNAMACDFEIEDDRATCEHEEDEFLPNTIYTATINGVACEDGTPIAASSWSWTTEDDD